MFENIGATEIVIIGIVIIVFFGSGKLKEVARGLGESSKEVKKAKKEFDHALVEAKADLPEISIKRKRGEKIENPKPIRAEGGNDNV